jgi:hypothetical protein
MWALWIRPLKSAQIQIMADARSKLFIVQYPSESRTNPGFEWSILAGPGHLNAGPFECRTIWKPDHLKAGQKTVIKNILFMTKRSRLVVKKVRSSFQMVKRWPTIRKPDKLSGFQYKMAAKAIWKPDTKNIREMAIRKPDRPAFGGVLYLAQVDQGLWTGD